MNIKTTFTLIIILCSSPIYAWNALGHRLIAQIALDNLDLRTKKNLNHYNRKLNRVYRRSSLVDAAPWMDTLRYGQYIWLKDKHYINIPFSLDGTPVMHPPAENAVTAIHEAREVFMNAQSSAFEKGFSLRILLHVIGDLHQPLHSTSQFSKQFPNGDLGGNLVKLGSNPVADNLHAYWDRGGGLLLRRHMHHNRLKIWARQIESRWPCLKFAQDADPRHWALQSHRLAIEVVYKLGFEQTPTQAYQDRAKKLSERQLALAGCRLSYFLQNL